MLPGSETHRTSGLPDHLARGRQLSTQMAGLCDLRQHLESRESELEARGKGASESQAPHVLASHMCFFVCSFLVIVFSLLRLFSSKL